MIYIIILKKKKNIIKDKKYHKKLIIKNKLISDAKTRKDKIEIIKKLNIEYNQESEGID
jgi:hypothetical protein